MAQQTWLLHISDPECIVHPADYSGPGQCEQHWQLGVWMVTCLYMSTLLYFCRLYLFIEQVAICDCASSLSCCSAWPWPKLMYKQVAIHTPSSQCCSHLPWPDQPTVITFRVNIMEKSCLLCQIWAALYSALRYFLDNFQTTKKKGKTYKQYAYILYWFSKLYDILLLNKIIFINRATPSIIMGNKLLLIIRQCPLIICYSFRNVANIKIRFLLANINHLIVHKNCKS